MPPKLKVSIVGSAGRGYDIHKMTHELYKRMVTKAKEVITEVWKLDLKEVELVSGGAAWSDHIAVGMFLVNEVSSLTLHLPADWQEDLEKPQFKEKASKDTRNNPGLVANKLHGKFSKKINDNTLKHIESARMLGASTEVHNGFHARNTFVAKSDYLLAFTWAEGSEPPERGGTRDTWDKCAGHKLHIPLSSLAPIGQSPSKKKSSKRKHSSLETDGKFVPCKKVCTEAERSNSIHKYLPSSTQ